MKYIVTPKVLIALIIAVLFFGILAVAIITPSVILDFFKSITPDTESELKIAYIVLAIAGAILLYFTLRHKKPYKFKKKIKYD